MSKAVIQYFEQILRVLYGDRVSHPIINDEQFCFRQSTQEIQECSFLSGERQCMQKAGNTMVAHAVLVAGSRHAQGRGKIGLAQGLFSSKRYGSMLFSF